MPVTYIALSCFAAACSLVVAARVWANGDFTGRNALMALLIASAVWALFAGLYEFTPVVETKHWIINIYFPSIVTVPVAMLVFALQYSGNGRWVTRPMLATLVLIPILTVVAVWSNPHHWLFWSEIVWDYSEPFPIGRFSHGPAFWVWVF